MTAKEQPDSLRIRRRSDGAVLPTLFDPERVREVPRPLTPGTRRLTDVEQHDAGSHEDGCDESTSTEVLVEHDRPDDGGDDDTRLA